MRRLLVVGVLALLVAGPASSQADRHPPPSDGCLVVQNGNGTVAVSARGGLFGQFDSGRIDVETVSPADVLPGVVVRGATEVRQLSQTLTRYIGQSVRFRYTGGGPFKVTIIAYGIDLSAIGHGSASVSATHFHQPSGSGYTADAGSLCQKGVKPLPDTPIKVTLGPPGTG
jgi:hypothetical protein